MKRLSPLFLLALLAACDEASLASLQTAVGIEPPPPPAPPPLPVEVVPFLPPGTPATVVFQDGNGCYLFSIEATDPPSGFPVRDAAGNQVCAGQPAVAAAPTAASGA